MKTVYTNPTPNSLKWGERDLLSKKYQLFSPDDLAFKVLKFIMHKKRKNTAAFLRKKKENNQLCLTDMINVTKFGWFGV